MHRWNLNLFKYCWIRVLLLSWLRNFSCLDLKNNTAPPPGYKSPLKTLRKEYWLWFWCSYRAMEGGIIMETVTYINPIPMGYSNLARNLNCWNSNRVKSQTRNFKVVLSTPYSRFSRSFFCLFRFFYLF